MFFLNRCKIGRKKSRAYVYVVTRQFGHVAQTIRHSLSKNGVKVNLSYRCEEFHGKNTSFKKKRHETNRNCKREIKLIEMTDQVEAIETITLTLGDKISFCINAL